MSNSVKVYTINGAASGSTTSLPDWLIRKRAAKGKGKRAIREHVEGTIDLIQHFEFPEASNRIRTTRDGHYAIATGVYKPQMRVWDLDQLTLKFERHSDVENVDFVILSNDWTKTVHLQTDRTIELHTQGGFHYRMRIPCFGRSLGYHFPSCDLIISASGPEVYRLNLDQGRFMIPLDMRASGGTGGGNVDPDTITGVNVVDINPAHQLFAFAIDGGSGTVQFWDPRSRSRVDVLTLPTHGLLPVASDNDDSGLSLSATAIASRSDGLSYAIGTSTGHTLLYDIRSRRHYAMKDQGYGLPVKCLEWVEGGSRVAGDGMVISADKKVIKIWDRNSPSTNFASITPSTDINHLHQIPGSGLIMLANEGIQMNTYYIPQLGPAPKWCSFLDNITEEMEDQTSRTLYEDYKFVERSELAKLGLDHLIGTPALKPYMHGYFLSLKLYDTARVIANPYIHEEHRQKLIKEKLEKQAETRIRARKGAQAAQPKVNKLLAEKIRRETEREVKREEKKKRKREEKAEEGGEQSVAQMETTATKEPASLLTDERFKALFENPEFEVDTQSREYNLLNPSAAELKRRRTAVEEEEDESQVSSDDSDLQNGSSEEGSSQSSRSDDEDTDSSEAGDLHEFNPRARGQAAQVMAYGKSKPNRARAGAGVKLVPLVPQTATTTTTGSGPTADIRSIREVSFGERRRGQSAVPGGVIRKGGSRLGAAGNFKNKSINLSEEGVMEMTWVPSATNGANGAGGESESAATGASASASAADGGVRGRGSGHGHGGRSRNGGSGDVGGGGKEAKSSRGIETFGAGMEKGRLPSEEEGTTRLDQASRFGRTKRRSGVRSGSRNVFRQLS